MKQMKQHAKTQKAVGTIHLSRRHALWGGGVSPITDVCRC